MLPQSIQSVQARIKKRDGQTAAVVFLLTLGFLLSIGMPGSAVAINAPLLSAIPLPVAILMLVLPFTVFWGLWVHQEVKVNDYVKEKIRAEKELALRRILMRIRFKPSQRGTQWEIRNANPFPWTRAHLLLEREWNGEKYTEKYQLGAIQSGEKVLITSGLEAGELVHWRTMLVADQGRQIDFPDQWGQAGSQSENLSAAVLEA